MSSNNYTPKKFTPSILKKCKGVIEELQQELTRVNLLNKQQQEMINMLSHEKNYFTGQTKEYEQLMSQLKKANMMLKTELQNVKRDTKAQDEILELKKLLATKERLIDDLNRNKRHQFDEIIHEKDQQIDEMSTMVKQLEQHIQFEQQDKKQLDKQWHSTLEEVTHKIREIQAQLKQRNEVNLKLQTALQNRQCGCQETINEIKKINMSLQNRYHELELAHSPKKYASQELRQLPSYNQNQNKNADERITSHRGNQSSRETIRSRSVSKLPSSRSRINNSAYLNRDYQNDPSHKYIPKGSHPVYTSNPQDQDQTPKPFQPQSSTLVRKPFFMHEHLQREVASTRATIQSQYQNLNHMGRIDNQKIHHTLNDLETKLQRIVRRMEKESNDSFIQ